MAQDTMADDQEVLPMPQLRYFASEGAIVAGFHGTTGRRNQAQGADDPPGEHDGDGDNDDDCNGCDLFLLPSSRYAAPELSLDRRQARFSVASSITMDFDGSLSSLDNFFLGGTDEDLNNDDQQDTADIRPYMPLRRESTQTNQESPPISTTNNKDIKPKIPGRRLSSVVALPITSGDGKEKDMRPRIPYRHSSMTSKISVPSIPEEEGEKD